MKNNNRKFFKDKANIFENLSVREVHTLSTAEITFTNVTGFIYLRKSNVACNKLKIARQQLQNSMKESLYRSQN
jgi:hypothetical protein